VAAVQPKKKTKAAAGKKSVSKQSKSVPKPKKTLSKSGEMTSKQPQMSQNSGKLTEKQRKFADYYIECGNATEAAIRAGYAKKSAKETGCENLTKPNILDYIAERTRPTEEKRIASGDEVMEFLTAVMRGEVKDAFDLPPSLADRKDAAKELAKRTVDIEAKRANVDIIQNMRTVAEILMNAVPDRKIEDYE